MEAPMSSSLGSMGPLLRKLDSLLLAPDGSRLPKLFKSRIESLKMDLIEDIVNPLVELSEEKSPDPTANCWMTEVRELTYDIEDSIDEMTAPAPAPAPATRSSANKKSCWRRAGCAKIAWLPRMKWSTRIHKAAQLWLDLVREAIIDRQAERYLLGDDSSDSDISIDSSGTDKTTAPVLLSTANDHKMKHAAAGSRRQVSRHPKPARTPLPERSERQLTRYGRVWLRTQARQISHSVDFGDLVASILAWHATCLPVSRHRPHTSQQHDDDDDQSASASNHPFICCRVGRAKIAGLPRMLKRSTRVDKVARLRTEMVWEAIDRHQRYLQEEEEEEEDISSAAQRVGTWVLAISVARHFVLLNSMADKTAPIFSTANPMALLASGSSSSVSWHETYQQHDGRSTVLEGMIDKATQQLCILLVWEAIDRQQRNLHKEGDSGSAKIPSSTLQHEFPSPTRYEAASSLVVGMDNTRIQLMNRIKCEDNKNLDVVTIVGPGGIGKTTLAKELYRQLGGRFMCSAFVRASRKPDMWKIMWDILDQIRRDQRPNRACNVQSLIDSIHRHLQDKRYFIVIDDLCQTTVWDIVVSAFPQSNNCSRILITTEMEDVALECSGYQSDCLLQMKPLGDVDSRELFMNIVFGSERQQSDKVLDEVSNEITRRSGGLPLAATCVASVARVSAIQETQLGNWSDIRNFLSTTLTSYYGTKAMMNEILHFCYDSLPRHLKTCLLYLSMYPEGYIIAKTALIRRWIAEGFICAASEKDTEETAGRYFNDLINRRLILPNRIKHVDGVISCTVHHMVLDMIKCKSREANFTTVTDYPHITAGLSTKVRRLSLQLSSAKHASRPATVAMPQVRSLAFFGLLECLPPVASYKFKLIRVLVLEIWGEHNGCTSLDFTRLRTLLHLRYVSITSDITVQLPDEIAGLQHLETFKVDARVSSVPLDIIDLPRLSHLRINDEIKLPVGIGRIRCLHTLEYFDLAQNSEDNVQSLGGLWNLQNLHLTCSKAGSEEHLKRNLDALSTSVGKLGDLCSLTLAPGASGAARIPLEGSIIVSCIPESIKRLEMSPQICIFTRLPECMGRLRKLRVLKISVSELLRNDMDRLNELPALVVLILHVRVARVGTVVIQSTSFPALRYFKYRSSVLSMAFRAGAMPNLECLKLGFQAHRGKQYGRMLGGVEHLRHLKEITGEIAIAAGASESDRRDAESAFHKTIEFSSQKWIAVSGGHPRFPSVCVKLADNWVVLEEEGHGGGATTDRNLVCENLPFLLDLLYNVISFTTPVDACRCSAVCTAFHAVASSDEVWDRFIPADYRSMLSRAVDPVDVGFTSTKKELFMTLAEQHILIDEGNKSFWFDRTTGAKSYMLASKSLGIAWGGSPKYWRRTASRDSRFEEVADLKAVCWLDIIATIDCRELSLNTTYTAYLVFGLKDTSHGLDSKTQEARITIAGEVSARHTVSLHARARSQEEDAVRPKARADGWKEVTMGDFYNGNLDDGTIEIRLMEHTTLNWKSGLIVEGVEIRPKIQCDKHAATS